MNPLLVVAVIGFIVLDFALYSIDGALHGVLEELRATRKAIDRIDANLKLPGEYNRFADKVLGQLQDIEKAVERIDLR